MDYQSKTTLEDILTNIENFTICGADEKSFKLVLRQAAEMLKKQDAEIEALKSKAAMAAALLQK